MSLSTELFLRLAEHATEGMLVLDHDMWVHYANPRAAEILGARIHLGAKVPLAGFFQHADLPDTAAELTGHFSPVEGVITQVIRLNRAEGQQRQVKVTRFPLSGPDGVLTGVMLEDVSDLVGKIRVVEQEQARYQLLVEDFLDPLIVFNTTGKIVSTNAPFAALVGWPKEQVVGRSLFRFGPPVHRDEGWRAFREAQETGRCEVSPFWLLHRDGSIIPTSLKGAAMGGDLYLATFRDIRRQLEMEQDLRRFKQAAASQEEGMLFLDLGGTITWANPAILRLAGRADSPQPGEDVRSWFVSAGEGGWFGHLVREGHWRGRLALRRSDHSTVEVAVSAGPVAAEGGDRIGYGVTVRDVTEELREEERRMREQRLASLGQLAAGVAHEFNNLMAVIQGYAELLERQPGNADLLRRSLTSILKSTERGKNLVGELASLGMPTGRTLERVDLAELLQECCARHMEQVRRHGINPCMKLEPAWISGDRTRLMTVLENLVTNALDALEGVENPEISAQTYTTGDVVTLVFADNGCGMDAATRARMFDPFFTTKASNGRLHGGMGLGMSLVDAILREHNAAVDIETAPGAGTTFRISFAAWHDPDQGHTPLPGSIQPVRGTPDLPAVLVVDDVADVRSLLRSLIEEQEQMARVLTARRPEDALVILSREPVVAIILDVRLPGMGSEAFLRTVRDRQPDLPVIVITGFADESERTALEGLGVQGWCAKPFGRDELVTRVAEVMHRRHG